MAHNAVTMSSPWRVHGGTRGNCPPVAVRESSALPSPRVWLVQAPQPGRLPGSVPQASEPPQRQVVAVDWWFASVNKRDVGFILAQPIHHTHAEADWWALDPWQGDEPMFA